MARLTTWSAARLALLIALPIALLTGLLTFWGLGGFRSGDPSADASPSAHPRATGPVPMPAPTLASRPATVCLALLSQLPDKLRDLDRRPVSAGAEQNAAYGDPPVTVACGSDRPAVPPTATLWVLSGVCWYKSDAEAASVWYTVDREVTIAVTMPDAYGQPGQWVTEFSSPIIAAVPSIPNLPSGCAGPP